MCNILYVAKGQSFCFRQRDIYRYSNMFVERSGALDDSKTALSPYFRLGPVALTLRNVVLIE
jgi:hypothetical protein